jgi:hypothetical protein
VDAFRRKQSSGTTFLDDGKRSTRSEFVFDAWLFDKRRYEKDHASQKRAHVGRKRWEVTLIRRA